MSYEQSMAISKVRIPPQHAPLKQPTHGDVYYTWLRDRATCNAAVVMPPTRPIPLLPLLRLKEPTATNHSLPLQWGALWRPSRGLALQDAPITNGRIAYKVWGDHLRKPVPHRAHIFNDPCEEQEKEAEADVKGMVRHSAPFQRCLTPFYRRSNSISRAA